MVIANLPQSFHFLPGLVELTAVEPQIAFIPGGKPVDTGAEHIEHIARHLFAGREGGTCQFLQEEGIALGARGDLFLLRVRQRRSGEQFIEEAFGRIRWQPYRLPEWSR